MLPFHSFIQVVETPTQHAYSDSDMVFRLHSARVMIVLSKLRIVSDYDRDGDKDVAIMGQSSIEGAVTAIYRNDSGTFVNTNQNFDKNNKARLLLMYK